MDYCCRSDNSIRYLQSMTEFKGFYQLNCFCRYLLVNLDNIVILDFLLHLCQFLLVTRILTAVESTDENISVTKYHIKYPNCASRQLNGLDPVSEGFLARCQKVLVDSIFYRLWRNDRLSFYGCLLNTYTFDIQRLDHR